jgi:hypothetical protein
MVLSLDKTVEQRIEALKPFADAINNNLELGLMQAWDVKGFNSLSKNTRAKLGSVDDPYYLAFANGILGLVAYVHKDDRISLVCDDDEGTAWDCYRHYRGIRKANPDVKDQTISLSFANDKYFPSLQAADFVAALTRLEARRRFYRFKFDFQPLTQYLIAGGSGPPKILWTERFIDEAQMIAFSKEVDRKI